MSLLTGKFGASSCLIPVLHQRGSRVGAAVSHLAPAHTFMHIGEELVALQNVFSIATFMHIGEELEALHTQ